MILDINSGAISVILLLDDSNEGGDGGLITVLAIVINTETEGLF